MVGDGPTYLTFDIDSLDPAFAPGTGTPEIGGLTTREAQAILRGLKGINMVGGDVVEVAPQYDATTNTAHAGAQMLFEIASLMVFSPSIGGRNSPRGLPEVLQTWNEFALSGGGFGGVDDEYFEIRA